MVAAIAAAMATSERISRDESLIVPAIPMIVAMAPGPKDERHGEGHESDIAACFAEESITRLLRHEQREANPHQDDPADDADHGEGNAKQLEDERPEDQEEEAEEERVEASLPGDRAMGRIVLAGQKLKVHGQDLKRIEDCKQGRERPGEE